MKSNKLNYNGFNSHSITGGPNGYPVPGLGIAITYNKDTKHLLEDYKDTSLELIHAKAGWGFYEIKGSYSDADNFLQEIIEFFENEDGIVDVFQKGEWNKESWLKDEKEAFGDDWEDIKEAKEEIAQEVENSLERGALFCTLNSDGGVESYSNPYGYNEDSHYYKLAIFFSFNDFIIDVKNEVLVEKKEYDDYLINIHHDQLYIMPNGDFARKMAEERGRTYEIIEDEEEFFVQISEDLKDKTLGYFDTKEEAEEAVKEDAEWFLNGLDDYIVASYNCPLAAAADIPSYIDSIAKLTNDKLSDDATESEIAFYLYQLLEELEEVKAEQE